MGMFNVPQAMNQNIAAQNALNGTAGPALTSGMGLFGSSVDPVAMQQMLQQQQAMQSYQSAGSDPVARLGAIQANNAKMLSGALAHGIDAFANGGQSSDPMIQKQQVLKNIQQQFSARDDAMTPQWFSDLSKTFLANGLGEQAMMAHAKYQESLKAGDEHTAATNTARAADDKHVVEGSLDYQLGKILGPKYENLKNQAEAGDMNAKAALTKLQQQYYPQLVMSEIAEHRAGAGEKTARQQEIDAKMGTPGGILSGDPQKIAALRGLFPKATSDQIYQMMQKASGVSNGNNPSAIVAQLIAAHPGEPLDSWKTKYPADYNTLTNAIAAGNPTNADILGNVSKRLSVAGDASTATPVRVGRQPAVRGLPSLANNPNLPPPALPPLPKGKKDFSKLWN